MDRRTFLGAAVIGAHALAKPVNPRILSLELETSAPLAEMRKFYHGALGLPILEEKPDRLTIHCGLTPVTFTAGKNQPFYHFAFNIPENKIVRALEWQQKRGGLIPIPERNRDPKMPPEVVDYSHWNAHSLFFYDPGGNVVEYIARHDMKNGSPGGFSTSDILYVSEIAFVVDDVETTAAKLKEAAGTTQYRGGSDQFMALGDESGLLLVMKRGRILNFHHEGVDKSARVYPTSAKVQGSAGPAKYAIAGFPYQIKIEG